MTAHAVKSTAFSRFEEYIDLLAQAMGHADRYGPLKAYCTGLLLPGERKSSEPMAAKLNPANVKSQHNAFQHLMRLSPWSDEEVLAAVQDFTVPKLVRKSADVSWIVDDTGVVKKGTHSVGVARQYCGSVGKQENCQVAVTLTIANSVGSLPIAHQLYLPESWASDPERRDEAKVPGEVEFLTKPQIAVRQIEQAYVTRLPRGPVLADAGYGDDTKFRDGISALDLQYCVGVKPGTTAWMPEVDPLPPPPYRGKGRPRIHGQRAPGHEPMSLKDIASCLRSSAYNDVKWREGAKGTMKSRFAAVRVHPAHRDSDHPKTRPAEWLLIEWPKGDKEPAKYWFSTMPDTMNIKDLVRLAKLRWRIERDYQELKDEIGLDHYEGRGWRGFHHHATLCIAAYAFLMTERLFFPLGETDLRSALRAPEVPQDYRPRGSATHPA